MENLITRYRNVTILVAILFAQVLGLAVQVKRSTENEPTRLIRIWAVDAVTPLEKSIVWFQNGVHSIWHNYFYLRGVRQENRDLKAEIERMRIAQVRISEDAEQARRLQVLLGFKEQFVSQTVAAQVIGSSGSVQSRAVYIDKGSTDGIKPDMAVITADGVVGKVLRVFNGSTSQVLLINDQTSGVGALLEKSRLQGVLRGTPSGEVVLEKVMSDEQVPVGETVVTSGGDRIFPKGLRVGTVTRVSPGADLFLNVRVKPAADLSKLEEVLVVTRIVEKEPTLTEAGPMRASDILAQRLPSVPDKPPADATQPGVSANPQAPSAVVKPDTTKPNIAGASQTPAGPAAPKPNSAGTAQPGNTATSPKPASVPGAAKAASPAAATVKPATAQKPAPAPTKVADQSGGNQVKPVTPKPKPGPPVQPQTEPAPPEEQPQ